jgi:hypothetical protein
MDVGLRDWLNEQILSYLPSDRVRQGDKINFRCPVCGDSKKNSAKKRGYYYLNNASFHCFNCDANLSGYKLLQLLSGQDYEELKTQRFKMVFNGNNFNSLSSFSYDEPAENKNTNVLTFKNVIKPEYKNELSGRAEDYLKNRLVLDAPFLKEKFYSYYAKNKNEYILIPWKINGVDAYYQVNDFLKNNPNGPKYIFPKNRDKLIYGLDNIDISFPYLICFEGVYDSLFVKNGIAIGGKNLTELQEKILKNRFPRHKIVFALDNDRPGLEATARELKKEGSTSKMFFRWFDRSTKEKDINDFVKSNGNVNTFADGSLVESMIKDSISMKMWLFSNGFKTNDKGKQRRTPRKVQ